ncbi:MULTISPECIES: class I SAM-dependent methyltransferase [unclassified Acinetobacter]|uniref:class I SAM-dependent methyltransferase n=1 Tax=unclassified Acinetobacter TaxID=196816 RepID=UPI002578DDB3|nr:MULTISPECIES: class I SAM-dependent methyltransferase [unclassified Acinetobacter]MDM1758193.1 methyltransferase domain-containing protein [Acinetobacter sp. 256-1]MDM1760643.1 methyltransferase domain-containing protein [Acinetobacter sp. 251-1]
MNLKQSIKSLRAPFFKLLYPHKQKFTCPICLYSGPFKDKKSRLHAKCPKCGENERARLQFLVVQQLFDQYQNLDAKVLHIAPEHAIQQYFQRKFKYYTSADKFRNNVDIQFDVMDIPFPDASFDILFASHILLYPHDDLKAISEMRRVLKPEDIAIIPMPIFAQKTVDDYSGQARWTHQSGMDYFDRYRQFFPQVKLYYSHMFPEQHQLYLWDNQPDNPLAVDAVRREEVVPICYVSPQASLLEN